jgi:hypothetical protein
LTRHAKEVSREDDGVLCFDIGGRDRQQAVAAFEHEFRREEQCGFSIALVFARAVEAGFAERMGGVLVPKTHARGLTALPANNMRIGFAKPHG